MGLGGMGGRIVSDRVHSEVMVYGLWDYALRHADGGGPDGGVFHLEFALAKCTIGYANR